MYKDFESPKGQVMEMDGYIDDVPFSIWGGIF